MEYSTLLDRIAHQEYATIGCSTKRYSLSAEMVDWIENNIEENSEFVRYKNETLNYLIDLKPAAYAFFVQSFQDIYDLAETIIVNHEEVEGLAKSSSYKLKTPQPSRDKLVAFGKFMAECQSLIIKEDVKISFMDMGYAPDTLEQQFESKKKRND